MSEEKVCSTCFYEAVKLGKPPCNNCDERTAYKWKSKGYKIKKELITEFLKDSLMLRGAYCLDSVEASTELHDKIDEKWEKRLNNG